MMDDLLKSLTSPRIKKIDVNGNPVFIKSLTVGEQVGAMQEKDPEKIAINILSLGVCDADGKCQFTGKNKSQLQDIPMLTANEIFDQIIKYNGMDTGNGKDADKKK